MAEVFEWVGNEAPVAQVEALRIGQINPLEEFTLIINNKTMTYTVSAAGTETESDVVLALVDLWNNSEFPETQDAVASQDPVDSGDILFTATVPGRPFLIEHQGNITDVAAKDVANRGPNVWGLAGNFWNRSTGQYMTPVKDAITGTPDDPTNGFKAEDEIHVRDSTRPAILYGLDHWANISATLTRLRIDQAYNSDIGLQPMNPRGYNEYLPQYLAMKFTAVDIGRGEGVGSSLIHLDLGDVKATVTVFNTGTGAFDDRQAVQIDGLGLSSTLAVHAGEVDVARDTEAGCELLAVQCFGGSTRIYEYCTMNAGGNPTSVDIHPNATFWCWASLGANWTVNVYGGTSTFQKEVDASSCEAIIINGPATVNWNGQGIANLTLDHPSALIDFSLNENPVTVATAALKRGTLTRGDCNLIVSSSLSRGQAVFSEP